MKTDPKSIERAERFEGLHVTTKSGTVIHVTVDGTPLLVEFTGAIDIERLPSGAVHFRKNSDDAGMKVSIEGPEVPDRRDRFPGWYGDATDSIDGLPLWQGKSPFTYVTYRSPRYTPWFDLHETQYQLRYLRHLVCDLIEQNCRTKGGSRGDIDAGFISCNAEAIRYLCEYGLMAMVHDGTGRAVFARSIPYEERIKK